ncbi:MAG: gamma-glutamyltransferase [Epsilonproteobacteria bacterium]|nr:gamma-glutamyltransferase [Campylobacterota bacterium]
MEAVVAAGDIQTANSAIEILKEGGNAFDAAAAALLSAPLAEPMLTSLGGGGFMMTFDKKNKIEFFDFFVDVPPKRGDKFDFFPIYVDFGNTIQEFHIGAASIAIPGVVAGIYKIHKEKGKLPLKEIIKPAFKMAKEGYKISKLQASFVKLLEPILLSTKESKELFAPEDRLIDENSIIKNPNYASFLEEFAKEGDRLFYEGEIAKEIDKISKEKGGFIRYEDLKRYRVYKREPITSRYLNYQISTPPPPSAGGILISFTLKLLQESTYEYDTFEYFQDLIESMAITAEFRKEWVDQNLHNNILKEIIQDSNIIEHYKLSKKSRINLWGNTTHLSIIDKELNCVSVTTTNGEGSGIVLKSSGIMLNNMLGEEDLNPNGFFKWDPFIRLPSMMSPTIILKDQMPYLILGSAGSNRIRSAIVQVVENFLKFNFNIQKAIDLKRLHFEKEELFLEPGFKEEIINKIKKRYKVTLFDQKSLFFGGVHAVTGDFKGGADKRRGGVVVTL